MQDEAGTPLSPADPQPAPTQSPDPTSADPTGPGARVSRRGLFGLLVVVAVVSYAADQLTKIWALAALVPGDPVDIVGEYIRLNLIRNPGAAFSIGNGATWVLTLIAFAVLVFILVTARRLGSVGWAWALGMLLGGSVGNLTDRMLREPGPGRGHVVDFIDYFGLFIGNVADIFIVGAAILIALLAVRGIGVDGVRPERGRHEAGSHA
jgi:signal peptidase II